MAGMRTLIQGMVILGLCCAITSAAHERQSDDDGEFLVRKGGGGKASGGSKGFSGSSSSSSTVSKPVSSMKPVNKPPVSTSTKTGTYRTSAPSGVTPRPGTNTGPTRPYTSSAMSSSSSFRPSTPQWSNNYGRSNIRPYYVAGAVALIMYSGRPRASTVCEQGRYRFGGSCRPCSQDACPIGQYRTECDAYNDAYCAPCTNSNTSSTYYTTPGNSNACGSESCSALTEPDCDLCYDSATCPYDSTPTTLSFFMEVPLSQSEFTADIQGRYKAGISAATDGVVQPTSVTFPTVTELTLLPADMDAGARRAQLGMGRRRLLQTATTPPPTTTAASSGGTTTAAAAPATTTPPPTPPPSPDVENCEQAPPEHDKFVEVVTEITVPASLAQSTWNSLSSYNLNKEFSQRCAPPAVVSYFSSARSVRWDALFTTALATLAALALIRN